MQSYFHIHPEAAAATAQIMTRPAQVDMTARKRSKSPSNSSLSQARPEEDWTKITDLAERRRIQNRIAQRNYRKKLKRRLLELENRASSPETDSPPNLNIRGVSIPEDANYSLSQANSIAEQTNIANTKRRSMSHLPPRTPFDSAYEAPRRQDRRHTMLSPPTTTFYNLPETSNQVHYLPKAYSAAIMPVAFPRNEMIDPSQIPYDHYPQMSPNYDPSHPFSDLRISPDIVELATDQDLLWTGEPSWQHPSWDFPEEHASLQYVHDWNLKMAASPASEMTRSISSHTASKQESDASGGEDEREVEEGLYGIKNELLDEDVLQWADFWKEQQLQEEFPQKRGLSP